MNKQMIPFLLMVLLLITAFINRIVKPTVNQNRTVDFEVIGFYHNEFSSGYEIGGMINNQRIKFKIPNYVLFSAGIPVAGGTALKVSGEYFFRDYGDQLTLEEINIKDINGFKFSPPRGVDVYL